MKKRPLVFQLVAAIFVAIALSFPVQISALYGHGPGELLLIFDKLTLFNWLSMGLLLGMAAMAWNGTRWMYLGIPATLLVVGWNNFLVGFWGYDYSLSSTFFASISLAGFCLFPFLPQYALVIQNPALRWWMVARRKEVIVPVYITRGRDQQIQTMTRDISNTGALIDSSSNDMALGDVLDINLKINSLQQLRMKAEVVRFDEDSHGVGVRFQNLGTTQKKALDKYLYSH